MISVSTLLLMRRAVLAWCEAEGHYRWPRTNSKANTESSHNYIFIKYLLTWNHFGGFVSFYVQAHPDPTSIMNIRFMVFIVVYWQFTVFVVTCQNKSRDRLESCIFLIGTHSIQTKVNIDQVILYWACKHILIVGPFYCYFRQ